MKVRGFPKFISIGQILENFLHIKTHAVLWNYVILMYFLKVAEIFHRSEEMLKVLKWMEEHIQDYTWEPNH